MKTIQISKVVMHGAFILLLSKVLSSYTEPKAPVKVKVIEKLVPQKVEAVEFSEENLKLYMNQINLKFKHIVLAQAMIESGYFKSKIFQENNNMFGMKQAKSRQTTNIGVNRGHAKYASWQDCVLDYALYQARYLGKVKTDQEYYSYLSNSYAGDPNYIEKVKHLANDILSSGNM
jgi:uncharacterized FlgJ-related protein